MVVPITDIVKVALSVADISAEPIIGTPLPMLQLICNIALWRTEVSSSQKS